MIKCRRHNTTNIFKFQYTVDKTSNFGLSELQILIQSVFIWPFFCMRICLSVQTTTQNSCSKWNVIASLSDQSACVTLKALVTNKAKCRRSLYNASTLVLQMEGEIVASLNSTAKLPLTSLEIEFHSKDLSCNLYPF